MRIRVEQDLQHWFKSQVEVDLHFSSAWSWALPEEEGEEGEEEEEGEWEIDKTQTRQDPTVDFR